MTPDIEEHSTNGPQGRLLVLTAPSNHEAVEELTDRVCAFLAPLRLGRKPAYRLKVAVHEALSNAVEHGNRGDPTKRVTVTCHLGPTELTIAIEDEGNGFDPASLPDPTQRENLMRESGRGIFLIKRYCDECRFEEGGRRVVIVKRLRARGK